MLVTIGTGLVARGQAMVAVEQRQLAPSITFGGYRPALGPDFFRRRQVSDRRTVTQAGGTVDTEARITQRHW